MIVIFLINSLIIIIEHNTEYEKITGKMIFFSPYDFQVFILNLILIIVMNVLITDKCDSYVMQPFSASMIGIGLSFIAVILLFVGLIRNIAALLIPHLIIQVNCFHSYLPN